MAIVCNELLGTSVSVERGKGIAEMIKAEMFHPRYLNDVPVSGKIAIIYFSKSIGHFLHKSRLILISKK